MVDESRDVEKERNEGIAKGIVRSIQNQEGNPECFDAEGEYCEETRCLWRAHCGRAVM